jgi:rfaE bifunctional protein nucleotidyltransferase chain/domain
MRKIVELKDIWREVSVRRTGGVKVALCHGVFDLFHIGHLRHLAEAKRHGDVLVVSITADEYVNKGPDRPVFPAELRSELLAGLDVVDFVVVVHHSSAEPIIEAVQPDIYVKGGEYADPDKDITGRIVRERELVERFGGRIVFTHDVMFSSSNLLNNHFNLLDKAARAYVDEAREAGAEQKITDGFSKIEKMKVLLIGETIIDHYDYVAPMGKAAKENIIATLHQDEEWFAGGVIAAANHLASLTANIELVTILGDPNLGENYEGFVRDNLAPEIDATFFYRPNGPTVQKTRFVEPTYVRKLFEVYHMDDTPLPDDLQQEIHNTLEAKIAAADVVIVLDFGHGLITNETIPLLEKARFLAINAQSNAGNIGYNLITKYRRADFVCIDAMEARLAAGDKHMSLQTIVGEVIPGAIDCPNVIVTHGKTGCFTSGQKCGEVVHVPAFRRDIVDTVGAGDAFFVVAAPFVAAGADCAIAGFVGNAAGAIKVGIVGHRRNLSKLELHRYMTTLLK